MAACACGLTVTDRESLPSHAPPVAQLAAVRRALGTEMTSDDASDRASECTLIALLISWPACAPRATRDS